MSGKHLIFVDGQEGTTGLKIHEMLAPRDDLEVLRIDPERRKDRLERARLINEADLVFLCLPDTASREAAQMVVNPATKLIDASTAFRTAPDWVYGLAELAPGHREKIQTSRRVANPGCHATAFLLLVRPLVDAGLVERSQVISATSITGFSGGGKSMISEYEGSLGASSPFTPFTQELSAPRPYALGLAHKHLPEMTAHAGLGVSPFFVPVVGPFYQGLMVSIALVGLDSAYAVRVHECLSGAYHSETFVRVLPMGDPQASEGGFFNPQRCNHTNRADLLVFPSQCGTRALLIACIDNLGKGASGGAVQNMNLMLGLDEAKGLSSG